MKINRLSISNFRRFQSLEIDFHPELTVIVARNGQGKSSLLDAGAIALGTFVGAFDHGKAKHIEKSDARYLRRLDAPDSEQQFPVQVEAELDFGAHEPIYVLRQLTGLKNKTTIKDAADLTHIGQELQKDARDVAGEREIDLPVIALYGTGRLWKAHKNMERKSVLSESRTMGYEDCLSSASNFVQLQQWMRKAELARLQQAESLNELGQSNLTARIRAIQRAVEQVIEAEGWTGFRYSVTHEELAMRRSDTGELPVSLLSDGVRAMVTLVADIAWRCARLNGHLGEDAARKSQGIVFIDEVDIHLHPAWQQRVIASLRNAFPNIQFVVSTHSPQVLSTVRRENIRVVSLDSEVAPMPMAGTYGQVSSDVLHSVMFVDPQPPIQEKQALQRLTELVDQGLFNEPDALRLFADLESKLGNQHAQLRKLRRSIDRQQALGK